MTEDLMQRSKQTQERCRICYGYPDGLCNYHCTKMQRRARRRLKIECLLDADPFAPCEQELLDRPTVREFPDLDEEEEHDA